MKTNAAMLSKHFHALWTVASVALLRGGSVIDSITDAQHTQVRVVRMAAKQRGQEGHSITGGTLTLRRRREIEE